MPVLRAPRPPARSSLARQHAATLDALVGVADRVEERAVEEAQRILATYRGAVERALVRRDATLPDVLAAIRSAAATARRELVEVLVRAQGTTLEAGAAGVEVLRPIAGALLEARATETVRAREQHRAPGMSVGSGPWPTIRIQGVRRLVTGDLRQGAARLAASEMTSLVGAARDRMLAAVQRAALGDRPLVEAMADVDRALPVDRRGGRVTSGVGSSAERIVRTQLNGLYGEGQQRAAKALQDELGVTIQKEWIATFDSRTRAAHLAAHGQRVPVREPFVVGGERLMHPGAAGGSARNVINCRCRSVTVLPDDPEDLFRSAPAPDPSPAPTPQPPPPSRPTPLRPTRAPQPTAAPQADKRRQAARRKAVRAEFSRRKGQAHEPIELPEQPTSTGIQDHARAPGNAAMLVRQHGRQGRPLREVRWNDGGLDGAEGAAYLDRGRVAFSPRTTRRLADYLAWKGGKGTTPADFPRTVYEGVRVVLHEALHLGAEAPYQDQQAKTIEEGITELAARDLVDVYMARYRRWRGTAARAWREAYLGARERMPRTAHYNPQVGLIREIADTIARAVRARTTASARVRFLLRAKEQASASARVEYFADQLAAAHDLDDDGRRAARELVDRTTRTLQYRNTDRTDEDFRRGWQEILRAQRDRSLQRRAREATLITGTRRARLVIGAETDIESLTADEILDRATTDEPSPVLKRLVRRLREVRDPEAGDQAGLLRTMIMTLVNRGDVAEGEPIAG